MKTWLVALTALCGVAMGQSKEPPKVYSEVEIRREATREIFLQQRAEQPPPFEVVYGADDRKDVYQVSDPQLLQIAQAACVVVFVSELTNNGNGTYTLDATPWLSQGGTICAMSPSAASSRSGSAPGSSSETTSSPRRATASMPATSATSPSSSASTSAAPRSGRK